MNSDEVCIKTSHLILVHQNCGGGACPERVADDDMMTVCASLLSASYSILY